MVAEATQEKFAGKRRNYAVDVCCAGAQRDQREHIQAAMLTEAQPRWKNGQPAQRTTGVASAIQANRRAARDFAARPFLRTMERATSGTREDAYPEAASHVTEFGIFLFGGGDCPRF